MALRKVKKWYYILLAGAAVSVCTAGESWIGLAIGALLLLAACVLLNRYWRCPSCGKQLGRMRIGVFECPHCKEKIEA